MRPIWIGINTGGTFTDLVLVDLGSGAHAFHKIPTTPDDPSRALLAGIRDILDGAATRARDVELVSHGTTLATNAVVEGKWAATGMMSAIGLLHADARGDFSATRLAFAEPDSLARLNAGLDELSRRGQVWLGGEGLAPADAIYEWLADMRYFGQNFERPIAFGGGPLDEAALERLTERFHASHEQAYGYRIPGHRIEVVNLRLAVTVPRRVPPAWQEIAPGGSLAAARLEPREVWFPQVGFVATDIYRREALPAEAVLHGPAIIEQMDATTVVPPGAEARLDAIGNLMIRLDAAARETSASEGEEASWPLRSIR